MIVFATLTNLFHLVVLRHITTDVSSHSILCDYESEKLQVNSPVKRILTLTLSLNISLYKDHWISFENFFRMGTFIDSSHMKL